MFEAPEACNAYVTLRHTGVKYHLSNFQANEYLHIMYDKALVRDRLRSMQTKFQLLLFFWKGSEYKQHTYK